MKDARENRPAPRFYEPSGKIDRTILWTPLVMAAAVFPAAWLYVWLVVHTFLREWVVLVFIG